MGLILYDSRSYRRRYNLLSIAEFKRVAETLGRFADVRETAKEPQDRIVVQASNGLLKLVAGDDSSTVIVEVGQTEATGKAIVSSRLLLTAAKSLRGKGTVDLAITPDGAQLTVSGGGRVKLNNISQWVPDFVRPPQVWTGRGAHDGLETIAKLLPGVAERGPWQDVYMVLRGSDMEFVVSDGRQHVEYEQLGPFSGEPALLGYFPASKLGGLRGFDQSGFIDWDERTVVFSSGENRAVIKLQKNPEWFPPRPALQRMDVCVTVDRRKLTTALLGLKPNDEHARVRIATSNDGIVVSDWNGVGSVELTAGASGPGKVGLDATRLKRLLDAVPGKDVSLMWSRKQPSAIRLESEAKNCLVLLAPVV